MRIIGTFCGITLLLTSILLGSNLAVFFDMYALVLVLGGTLSFGIASHGIGPVIRGIRAGYASTPLHPTDGKEAIWVLHTLRSIAYAMGGVGVLIGVTRMLHSFDEPSHIGPFMALSLLSLLYSFVIAGLWLSPICERIQVEVGPSVTPQLSENIALFGLSLGALAGIAVFSMLGVILAQFP